MTTPVGTLIVKKVFDCSKKSPSSEIFIVANHPTAKPFSDILSLKQNELQKIVNDRGLKANRSIYSQMRKAIWHSVSEADLQLSISDIDVSKASGGSKELRPHIEKNIPAFALFQNDRQSTDADDEVSSSGQH